MRAPAPAVVALALAAVLMAGCQDQGAGDPDDGGTTAASGGATSSTPPTTSPRATDSPSPSGSDEPDTGRLSWKQVPGPTSTTVTVSGPWTLSVPQSGREAVLDGPDPRTVATQRQRVTDALIDGEYAVVVTEDERAEQANVATVVELASGRTFTVDGDSDVPTTVGGAWALGGGRLLHATERGGAYCLASVDLASRDSEVLWCAPKRSGFNGVRVTDAGTTLLSFDDSRPSCRTVGELRDGNLVPFEDAPECTGWDALLLGDAAVWSVVAAPNRIEEAKLFVRTGGETEPLGPGTSGTLVACGGSAYFVRDPQRGDEPARLMRWTAEDGLSVAYETRAVGGAFLSEPRCGGDAITLTALTERGDEQVTAPLD